MSEKADYKKTIRLPKTEFPMKANLAQREPQVLARWAEERAYEKVLEARAGAPRFVFHDGPPYANGHIHYGTIFNKVLKDFVTKYQSLAGRLTRFVPGWDCHGLPIELNVERALGRQKKAEMSKPALREACKKEAEKWIDVQRSEFQRLGCFGTWDTPYLTMHPRYERGIVDALGAFVRHGLVYRGKRPVYWCGSCRTALAEAEIEYHPHVSPSIYVKFPFTGAARADAAKRLGLDGELATLPSYAVIWTTTPWTIPANLAIAVHPELDYQAVRVGNEIWLLAQYMRPGVLEATKKEGTAVGDVVKGATLEGLESRHPFEDRASPFVLADHVTLEAGTGLVHTAPGHGHEDFDVGQKYGLGTLSPLDDGGAFTDEVRTEWRGLRAVDANESIVKFLDERGALANRAGETISHQYAHCWRCKNPVLYRATTQWFIALDEPMKGRDDRHTLRRVALDEIDRIAARRPESGWIPAWGRDRIHGMVKDRPDWVISRQRAWGVPIPAFHCRSCRTTVLTEAITSHVAEIFGREGADAWFAREAKDLVPPGLACPKCGGADFEKDEHILDVWFESGASFWSVMNGDAYGAGLGVPVDLYLEGSDQHRGWFHSTLLVGCAVLGRAPYERVLTHGFVCDDQGRPYSKTEIRRRQEAGEKVEYIEPATIIGQQGAELLRMWAAYEDYRGDPRFSRDHLKQVGEAYFKVRNTLRFLLGNLDGYTTDEEEAPVDPLDAWARARLRRYQDDVFRAYEAFDFRAVHHRTVEVCTTEWSSFYLDVLKDRLYCDSPGSTRRRSSRATIDAIVRATIAAVAPILCFTADEAWRHLPGRAHGSVWLDAKIVPGAAHPDDAQLLAAGQKLFAVRDALHAAMEPKRRAKEIDHPREARAVITMPAALRTEVARVAADLSEALAISEVEVREGETLAVEVSRTDAPACARCWRHRRDVRGDLCARCAEVLS